MTNLSDPLERLRAANPVSVRDAALLVPDPVLFRRIIAGVPASRPAVVRPAIRPARRRGRRLVPALLVGSLLGGAVGYAVLRDGPTKPEHVECFATASLDSAASVAPVDERGPVAACAEVWRRAEFGTGIEVPALVGCVLDSGVVGVFPALSGQDVCTQLGVPPIPQPRSAQPQPTALPAAPPTVPAAGQVPAPSSAPADVSARVLAFRDAVSPQFDVRCVDPKVAAVTVRRELDRAGLTDWTIRGGGGLAGDGFTPERPCATLSVRTPEREVVLVPGPPLR